MAALAGSKQLTGARKSSMASGDWQRLGMNEAAEATQGLPCTSPTEVPQVPTQACLPCRCVHITATAAGQCFRTP